MNKTLERNGVILSLPSTSLVRHELQRIYESIYVGHDIGHSPTHISPTHMGVVMYEIAGAQV